MHPYSTPPKPKHYTLPLTITLTQTLHVTLSLCTHCTIPTLLVLTVYVDGIIIYAQIMPYIHVSCVSDPRQPGYLRKLVQEWGYRNSPCTLAPPGTHLPQHPSCTIYIYTMAKMHMSTARIHHMPLYRAM